MRANLTIVLLLLASYAFSQAELRGKKPSHSDSLLLSELREKIGKTINSNPDSAFIYIKKFGELSRNKHYARSTADAYYLQAQYFRRIQNSDSAIFYFEKLNAQSAGINYYRGLSMGYNGLCRTYYLIGKIEKSIEAGTKSLQYINQFKDEGNAILADTHNALGIAYSRQNKLKTAINHLLIVDSIHKKEPLRADIIAAAYQSLGNVYLELKQYDAAEQYYLKANKEFEKIPEAGIFYSNITNVFLGEVYYFKGKLNKADSLLSKTLLFFEKIADKRTVAEIHNYLGLINLAKGNLESAEVYFKNALQFQKENLHHLEAAQSALQLGELYLKKGKPAEAIDFFQQALFYNRNVKNGSLNNTIYSKLAQAYALQGNYKEAYKFSEIATAINDSIHQIQTASKIKEIEAIYQTESRDREIALLTAKNELVVQQKKYQRNLLWGILGLIMLATVFVILLFRNRQRITEKLKELDIAKSTFFANISHEFRTPLTLVTGPIEDQLASENLSPSTRRNLKSALRNTQRLKDLVDQLLALAKLEKKQLKLNIQPDNMPSFIIAHSEAFAFECQEKNIRFSVEVIKDEILDWFDQDVLDKILYNLVGNALKYTPENGFIILNGIRNGENYEISLTNSGSYINPDQRQKIFERFYQINNKNPGTGIGLSLTKELVEIHKGTITLTSEEHGNTEFKVILPVNKTAFGENQIFSGQTQYDRKETESVFDKNVEAEVVLSGNAPVVLVIDDSRDIREYVRSIFETTHLVFTANNGKEGFKKAIEHIPDIVISDVMMPEEDGFTLTKHLKENELTSHIPVILLTAKTHIVSKLEGMGIGADAYVTKPFNSQLLRATVENLLENRRKLQQRFSQEVVLTSKKIDVSSAEEQFLERLQTVFDHNITDPGFTSENFGSEMGISRMQLHRKLKALTGQSASEFLRSQRLRLAIHLLEENKISISEVGYSVGFNDPSYFTKCFKQEYGVPPSEYCN